MSDEGRPQSGGPATDEPTRGERLSADAVRALYDVHARDLLVFLTGVLRNADAAQDVCQATFQRLLEVGHGARDETRRGWLFKVGFHEALAYRRRAARHEKTGIEASPESSTDVTEGSLQAGLEGLVHREDVIRIRELLNRLPPEQQQVVRLRIHEEKTFQTIADELRIPLGTVLTRMRLALQKLQVWFGRES